MHINNNKFKYNKIKYFKYYVGIAVKSLSICILDNETGVNTQYFYNK